LSGIVARLISMAVMIHIRLPLIKVTSLASMATSVPVPMAKPTSACVRLRKPNADIFRLALDIAQTPAR
jgi:hypothetical protein